MLQEIINTVKGITGNEFLYLDTQLQIKKTPHSHPVNIWALAVDPHDRLWLMDADEFWWAFEGNEDEKLITESLYQRVMSIKERYAAA